VTTRAAWRINEVVCISPELNALTPQALLWGVSHNTRGQASINCRSLSLVGRQVCSPVRCLQQRGIASADGFSTECTPGGMCHSEEVTALENATMLLQEEGFCIIDILRWHQHQWAFRRLPLCARDSHGGCIQPLGGCRGFSDCCHLVCVPSVADKSNLGELCERGPTQMQPS